jgi:hypothetical protein
MSPSDADHFTDMDGDAIEDSPEPLPCPFCGSGGDQLVVERWSEEDDPDASYHVVSSAAPTGLRVRHSSRPHRVGTDDRDSGEPIAPPTRGQTTARGVESAGSRGARVLDNQSDALQRDTSILYM